MFIRFSIPFINFFIQFIHVDIVQTKNIWMFHLSFQRIYGGLDHITIYLLTFFQGSYAGMNICRDGYRFLSAPRNSTFPSAFRIRRYRSTLDLLFPVISTNFTAFCPDRSVMSLGKEFTPSFWRSTPSFTAVDFPNDLRVSSLSKTLARSDQTISQKRALDHLSDLFR